MRLLNWLYDKYVTFAYTAWLRPTARRGERLLKDGTQSRGRIAGIRVRLSGDADSSTTRYEFAVDVTPSAGEPFRAGIRQALQHGDRVRLGMHVLVRHDERGRRAIIDWPAMLRSWGLEGADVHEMGWKPLRKPPAEGLDDGTLPKLKGERTSATLTDAARHETAFGPTQNWNLVLDAGGRALTAKRAYVPIYARHLIEPGTVLPVAVDGDNVRVDWPAAVEQRPGSAEPPAEAAINRSEPVETMTAAPAVSPAAAVAAAPVGDAVEGVSFDTWVAIEAGIVRERIPPDGYDEYAQRHGVAPGRWAAAQAGWQARMTSDWTIGARFGEAYEAALKGRGR